MTTTKESLPNRIFNKLIVVPDTNERKNFSMWMMFGGAVIFTIYASVVLYLVREDPHLVFWLGIAAHAQVFSLLAGFVAQLVKRRISAGKDGLSIQDEDTGEKNEPTTGVTV